MCEGKQERRKQEGRKEGKKERKKDRTKLKFSCAIFSTKRRINGTLGVYFTLE